MKRLKILMCDAGFGANKLGIFSNRIQLQTKYKKMMDEVEYIPYEVSLENMSEGNKKYYNTVYSVCSNVYNKVLESLYNDEFFILIGGDHSLSLGSIKAVLEKYQDDVAVIWIDAHADINTFASTSTGNIHGMPVASLLGINDEKYNNLGNSNRLKSDRIVYFATRSIDVEEKLTIEKLQILNFSDENISNISLYVCLEKAIEYLRDKVSKIHISLDLDALNPELIMGVSTPVKNGMDLNGPREIIGKIKENFDIVGMDIVEYNTLNDLDGKTSEYLYELIMEMKKI